MLDIVAWHGRTSADHQTQLNTYAAKGYRTLSLSVYNGTSNPLYASVMIKRPVLVAEKQFFGQTAAQFQQTFNEMSAAGMGPHIVTATGPASAPLIAASFIPVSPTPLTRFGISAAEFETINQQQISAGGKLVWFDVYGDSGNDTYIATWWPNPDMMSWNCDGVGESGAAAQARFNALNPTYARLTQVMTTPSGTITSLYTDSVVGQYEVQYGLNSDQYQAAFTTWTAKGLAPLRVNVQGNGIFGVSFGQTEDSTARVMRSSGPVTVASVDNAIETYMKAANIKDCSLAIVNGSRLVYAKGYTWADAGYPDTQPTNFYRLASGSKVFTAYALYHLLQEQAAKTPAGQTRPTLLSLLQSTTLQSVLHLTQPNGAAPADPKFAQITLYDLITSTSGLDQGLVWQSVAAAAAANAPLPATRQQLAKYGASKTFTATPGNPKNVVYGNFDYFLLGEVVRVMSGAATFEAALETLVQQPLAITRVRGSRSLIGDQLPGEAAYHLDQPAASPPNNELTIAQSTRSPGQPMVASQYGNFDVEMLSSCGGVSAAVTDMARLVASLSLANGPALTADTISQWMTNAVTATSTLSGPDAHGYHGWDWVYNQGNGIYYGDKGGALSATGTETYFTTGGLSYIFFVGSSGRPGNKVDWYAPVQAAAKANDWGTTDLFPQYGMPSFPTLIHVDPIPPIRPLPVGGVLKETLLTK